MGLGVAIGGGTLALAAIVLFIVLPKEKEKDKPQVSFSPVPGGGVLGFEMVRRLSLMLIAGSVLGCEGVLGIDGQYTNAAIPACQKVQMCSNGAVSQAQEGRWRAAGWPC